MIYLTNMKRSPSINSSDIASFLDQYLNTSAYSDSSQNGLQVDAGNRRVKKVALAVDSGLSVIKQAVKYGADLMIVHHGLLWGEPWSATGILGEKVRTLIGGPCSLYASHLPLDGSLKCGNAAQLARAVGLTKITPFFNYHGATIGVRGEFKHPHSPEELQALCQEFALEYPVRLLKFGKKGVNSVAIATGSASQFIGQVAQHQIDLFITGEPKQALYHQAKELKQNVILAGHYATETFGVKAIGELLTEKFNLKCFFIDEPTGI